MRRIRRARQEQWAVHVKISLVASLQQLAKSSVLEVHGYGVDQKNLVGKHFATFRV